MTEGFSGDSGIHPHGVVIVTHVGAGSTQKVADIAKRAGILGLDILKSGGTALDAVEEEIVLLEDDILVGVLAVSGSGYGVSCNIDMAWWAGKG